jgi:hypothetical protein
MTHQFPRLGALVALVLLAACSGNSESATPTTKAPVATAATLQVTLQPAGTGQHQLVPGVASWLDQYDGDYRLCIPTTCAVLLPVAVMDGWNVSLLTGNDGTPLLSFKPSGVVRPQYQLDAARELMRVRLAEVAARLALKTSKQFCADGDGDNPLRDGNGRTSKTAARPGGSSLCGSTGTGDEPGPSGGGGGGFDGPVEYVPGERPPPGEPWGGVPGGGGLEPPAPDGGGGDTSEVGNPVPAGCILLPPAELICGLPVVPVPAPRPEGDPDALPRMPPVWDWCAILGIGCSGTDNPPRPQLPPELDPYKAYCQARYIAEAKECLHKGEQIVDPAQRHESINACLGQKSVEFAHCMGESAPLLSPAAGAM